MVGEIVILVWFVLVAAELLREWRAGALTVEAAPAYPKGRSPKKGGLP